MGAKVPPPGGSTGGERKLSDRIGEMAEASRDEAQGARQEDKEPVRRADGTVLEARGEKPRNPKKKMFEADVEDAKYEASRKRDEL